MRFELDPDPTELKSMQPCDFSLQQCAQCEA